MSKEFLGADAVTDLFDIIDENYVSKEDFDNREKAVASAICVGSALIAGCLLKLTEAIILAKGAEGGENVDENMIATDSEVEEVIGKYFGNSPVTQTDENNSTVATDDEADEVINKYFN